MFETEVDAREHELRTSALAAALPAAGTSEGRQLRRWLTQLLVTERVVAAEVAARGLGSGSAPTEADVLPDATARLEIGSVLSAVLSTSAQARALFAAQTADLTVAEDEITAYHRRNPHRFAPRRTDRHGWSVPVPAAEPEAARPSSGTTPDPGPRPGATPGSATGPLPTPAGPNPDTAPAESPPAGVRATIEATLLGAARRRHFADWLDTRRAEQVRLAPGYEHPGDPRQPDNTHRH